VSDEYVNVLISCFLFDVQLIDKIPGHVTEQFLKLNCNCYSA